MICCAEAAPSTLGAAHRMGEDPIHRIYRFDTFIASKPQPEWLGILGPVIRAEVGDEIVVDFLNRSHACHDMHPHGLRYDKSNEGSSLSTSCKGSVRRARRPLYLSLVRERRRADRVPASPVPSCGGITLI